ncbi:MAG: hypothetical protein M1819_005318 [Sarea resinae]|nr:MAG: hypothetical protein M1819_005318 [Sarea resinae]
MFAIDYDNISVRNELFPEDFPAEDDAEVEESYTENVEDRFVEDADGHPAIMTNIASWVTATRRANKTGLAERDGK